MVFDVSRSWPRISIDNRPSPPPPPMPRIMLFWPPDGRARTITPGMPDSSRRSIMEICSFDAVALVARHQQDVDVAAVHRAAAEAAATATAAAGLADEAHALRHQLPDPLFHAQDHRFGALDARADRQLDVDLHFTLVGLRLELEADPAHQHDGDGKQRKPVANTVGRCASARCSIRA